MQTMNHRQQRRRNDMKGTRATPSFAKLVTGQSSAWKLLSFRMPGKGVTSPATKAVTISPPPPTTTTTNDSTASTSTPSGRTTTKLAVVGKERPVVRGDNSAASLDPRLYLEDDDDDSYGVNEYRLPTATTPVPVSSRPPLCVNGESFMVDVYIEDDDDGAVVVDPPPSATRTAAAPRDSVVLSTPVQQQKNQLSTVRDISVTPSLLQSNVLPEEQDDYDQHRRRTRSSQTSASSQSDNRCTKQQHQSATTTIVPTSPKYNSSLSGSSPIKRQRALRTTREELQRPSLRDFLAVQKGNPTNNNNSRNNACLETKSLHAGGAGGGAGAVDQQRRRNRAKQADRPNKPLSLRSMISEYESIVGDDP